MFFQHIDHPPLPELKRQQSATGKRFYITPEGNKYPSITTMLGHQEKPYLKEWRNMLGDKKADEEMKRTSERGTIVHELIEKYLNNEPYPELTKGYKTEYIKRFNQLKVRLNKINNIRAQECYLYSDALKLAGTADCVGEFNGKLCIIDFKTSNNNKDHTMIEDYYLQCAAYAIMWHERTGESIEDVAILMTVEKGMVPLLFESSIDKYVAPLLKRTKEYYKATTK